MASNENNLADRSGNLFESHKGYDPRIRLFYFITAGLMVVLIGGLAYQQIFKTDIHHEREKQQNQRRVIIPGPRGNIYDRNGQVLVRNRARLAIVLYLDELRPEFRREYIRIRKNYLATGEKDMPTDAQLSKLARTSVAQRYLDQVAEILNAAPPRSPTPQPNQPVPIVSVAPAKREFKIDSDRLNKHFQAELLLPYPLIEDLDAEDYARLIEGLPVTSPLQVYTANTREYPFGSAAAHTLGRVANMDDKDLEPPEEFSEEKEKRKIKTFTTPGGLVGRAGLERTFDNILQGEAGAMVFRVDPNGYKVNKPLEKQLPVQGHNIVTSLDIDLQLAAEKAIGEAGMAVALDVRTGEVLVLANKPDYDLRLTSPRISEETYKDIIDRDALSNYAISGTWAPGSTFKILTAIAGMRSGKIQPDQPIIDCEGATKIGNKLFYCYNGRGHHGEVLLPEAIAQSCDIYFYQAGLLMTPEVLAAEARRFHLDQRTGIELPRETSGMTIPDPEWKRKVRDEAWFPGDTANISIGQGDVLVTPLEMACFIASVARNETYTKPTLVHNSNAPTQHTEPIGLTPDQRAALLAGMEGTVTHGTGKLLMQPAYSVPNVRIAAKTGTAQKSVKQKDGRKGTINLAWFVCFAPVEKPEIAIAVMVQGDTIGEELSGGLVAAPIAATILRKYFDKQANPSAFIQPTKTANN